MLSDLTVLKSHKFNFKWYDYLEFFLAVGSLWWLLLSSFSLIFRFSSVHRSRLLRCFSLSSFLRFSFSSRAFSLLTCKNRDKFIKAFRSIYYILSKSNWIMIVLNYSTTWKFKFWENLLIPATSLRELIRCPWIN